MGVPLSQVRRQRAHLRAEIRVLPALQHLPLAIPLPERVAEPGDDRPWPFVGYRWLPGVPADRVDDLDPDVVLDALEAFLEAVHAVPRRAPFDSTVGWPLLPVEDVAHPVARRVVDWLAANPAPAVSDVFSHQDLGLGHVLVDPKTGRPTGVIDWGDMHWGDPATDWVGVLARWPEAVTARLAPEVVARAHRLHLMFALQDVLYGTEVDRSERGAGAGVGAAAGAARAGAACRGVKATSSPSLGGDRSGTAPGARPGRARGAAPLLS